MHAFYLYWLRHTAMVLPKKKWRYRLEPTQKKIYIYNFIRHIGSHSEKNKINNIKR